MINNKADEIIEELFKSLRYKYQNSLKLIKGSQSFFDYVSLTLLLMS